MPGANQYKAQEFIDAIPGTGGIISAIARIVGCDWHTADKYIRTYPTIQRAYNDECESIKDVSESVVFRNIQLAHKQQTETKKQVDSSDAKWFLSKKGKDRGYTERHEVTGAEGGEITVRITGNVKPGEL